MREVWLETLSDDECLNLLRNGSVGRIAIVANEFPIVLPVNYRLVEVSGPPWVAVRTRPGNVIDRSPTPAAFEIDSINMSEHRGWSVLVRGTLQHVNPESGGFRDRFDPQPWLEEERDAWLIIEPFSITGRRLHAPEPDWAFHVGAYL